jgi:hypothetical protein
MFGTEEMKNVFGTMTVAMLIEIGIALAGIFIVYKKLKEKIIGSYKERKQQQDDIKEALDGVRALPTYRQKSKEIQEELRSNDDTILETCKKIQDGVAENQRVLNKRLDKLEDRERNAIRSKILDMHRLFTSVRRNPLQAWSEMERDAFFDLIRDYESLNGNGHIHTVVIPDMNQLRVILMTDLPALTELFHSREV